MPGCIFCDIVAGRIPATELYRDEDFLAFRDIDPQAPVHILLIPLRHIPGLSDLTPDDADLTGRLILTATGIAADQGLDDAGYRFVVNCGRQGGQAVDHLHLHILGGRQMQWPPG